MAEGAALGFSLYEQGRAGEKTCPGSWAAVSCDSKGMLLGQEMWLIQQSTCFASLSSEFKPQSYPLPPKKISFPKGGLLVHQGVQVMRLEDQVSPVTLDVCVHWS